MFGRTAGRRHRRTTVTVHRCIGPDMDVECEVDVTIHPAEPMVMYDSNGEGYPGSSASAEILSGDAAVIEDGKRRELTDEEWGWLEEAEAEIEESAFAQAG